jgi:hypothetical protein
MSKRHNTHKWQPMQFSLHGAVLHLVAQNHVHATQQPFPALMASEPESGAVQGWRQHVVCVWCQAGKALLRHSRPGLMRETASQAAGQATASGGGARGAAPATPGPAQLDRPGAATCLESTEPPPSTAPAPPSSSQRAFQLDHSGFYSPLRRGLTPEPPAAQAQTLKVRIQQAQFSLPSSTRNLIVRGAIKLSSCTTPHPYLVCRNTLLTAPPSTVDLTSMALHGTRSLAVFHLLPEEHQLCSSSTHLFRLIASLLYASFLRTRRTSCQRWLHIAQRHLRVSGPLHTWLPQPPNGTAFRKPRGRKWTGAPPAASTAWKEPAGATPKSCPLGHQQLRAPSTQRLPRKSR